MKLWIRNILQNLINIIESEEDKTTPKDYFNDLCKTCENYWIDFPLPLEQVESHCVVVDEKVGFGKMNEVVPYPCLECPFNCYSKKKEL